MKFKDLQIDDSFKVEGSDVVYTKKQSQAATCCTKANNTYFTNAQTNRREVTFTTDDTDVTKYTTEG